LGLIIEIFPIHYLIAGAQTDVVECVGLKLDEERHLKEFLLSLYLIGSYLIRAC
jgi:hypothetical protein